MTEFLPTDLVIAGRHGGIPARLYRPYTGPMPGLVWLHGGGFTAGDLDMPEADEVSRLLAKRGITVLSVDYRLAIDGVHFPVPSDDAFDAFLWTQENRETLGMSEVSLGGASAGANICAGVALRLRDAGHPGPVKLVLSYPMVHAPLPDPDEELAVAMQGLPSEILDLNERVPEISVNYAGSSGGLADPYVMAGHGDLRGLPPTLVVNADIDLLRPSGEVFAHDIVAAGGTAVVVKETGTVHGYLNEAGNPDAARTIDRIASWLLDER